MIGMVAAEAAENLVQGMGGQGGGAGGGGAGGEHVLRWNGEEHLSGLLKPHILAPLTEVAFFDDHETVEWHFVSIWFQWI
jgi:hypothetical protein